VNSRSPNTTEAAFRGQRQIVVDPDAVIAFEANATVTELFHDGSVMEFQQTVTQGPNGVLAIHGAGARTWPGTFIGLDHAATTASSAERPGRGT
jgi:hypothetical protein